MLTSKFLFSIIISNDLLRKSDVIILLEGDYYERVQEAADLFRHGFAPKILVSGGVEEMSPEKIHSRKLKKSLVRIGVPEKNIFLEKKSQHTVEQAEEVMKIAKVENWKRIILVASHFHQFRAYLAFLKAMQRAGLQLEIYSAPARNIVWFGDRKGKPRAEQLEDEFAKIEKYQENLATFDEAIEYQKWKELQL